MRRDAKIVASFVGAIPVVILSAATICTWAIAGGASINWRLPFRVLCHGIAERCLSLFDSPMPICARCTGIYLGLLAGLIAYFVLPRVEERILRIILYVAALPMAIDGITQAMMLRESTNGLRVVTGFAAAMVFGIWILEAVEKRESPVVTIP
jgi:uncharacterized membrane protein